jgi:hypothetical protein
LRSAIYSAHSESRTIQPLPLECDPKRLPTLSDASDTNERFSKPVRPVTHSNRRDIPRLCDQLIPCVATMDDDVLAIFEDPVLQPAVARKLRNVFGGFILGDVAAGTAV